MMAILVSRISRGERFEKSSLQLELSHLLLQRFGFTILWIRRVL